MATWSGVGCVQGGYTDSHDMPTVTQGHTDSHTGTHRQSHRDMPTVTQTNVTLPPMAQYMTLLCGVPCSLSGDSHLPQNDGVLCVQFRLRQSINHYVPVFPAQWEEPRLQAPPLE